jgi:DnaD/phage-associated family protein
MIFEGFSTEGLIGLPPELFTRVLPAITQPGEIKVTLHAFYRLSQQRGQPRRIRWDDLAADRVLREGLRALSKLRPPEEMLEEGLEAAVRRGTLLHLALPGEGRMINWYLVHTEANRRWVEQVNVEQASAEGHAISTDEPFDLAPEQRLSVLSLYEQNIGLVTPILLDELREAEERYPYAWIEEAIREAVRANARSWRYVKKVLERWATDGRQHAPDQAGRQRPIDIEQYTGGAFGGLFRRGSDISDLS